MNPKRPRRAWCLGEVVAAQYYRACGATYSEIGRLLGRDNGTVCRKLNPKAARAERDRHARQRKDPVVGPTIRQRHADRSRELYQQDPKHREGVREYQAEYYHKHNPGARRVGDVERCACCGGEWATDHHTAKYCTVCRDAHADEVHAVSHRASSLAPLLRRRQRGLCAWSGEPLRGRGHVHHVAPWRTFPPDTIDRHTTPANTVLVLAEHHKAVEGLPHEAFMYANFNTEAP